MVQIFFGRHGRQFADRVTIEGYQELRTILARLKQNGFRAEACLSSSEHRSVETAEFLTGGKLSIILPELHAYGDLKDVGIVTGSSPIWFSAREYAIKALDAVLKTAPADKSLVVIGHDYSPLLLGWRYLELQGHTVNWDFEKDSFPNPGEGLLVNGTTHKFFLHSDAEGVT